MEWGVLMAEYKQLRYSMRTAFDIGITDHPQKVMREMGYTVLGAVPQSVYEQWWFTVEDFIEPLPEFLSEITYNFDYWHNECYRTCEEFKNNPSCCSGGFNCIIRTPKERGGD